MYVESNCPYCTKFKPGSIVTQRDEPFSPEEVFVCYDCQEEHACVDCSREGYRNLVNTEDDSCGYCIEREELFDPPPDGHNETDWQRDH